MLGVGEDGLGIVGQARLVVAHEIAHEPDEHEVGRVGERLVYGQDAAVVLGLEVLEAVYAAAREEGFPGMGGIGPIEGLGEEGVEVETWRLAQRLRRPAGERIAVTRLRGAPVQGLRIQGRERGVEALHLLEVVSKSAKLGRATEVEL